MHDAQARLTGLADRQRAVARLLHGLAGSTQPPDARPLYIHVDGPAGSGKTAVLGELTDLFSADEGQKWITVSLDAGHLGAQPAVEIASAVFSSLRQQEGPALRLRLRESLLRFPKVIANRTAGWLLLIILLPLVLSSRPEVIAVGIGLALLLLGAIVYAAIALPGDSLARTAAQVRKTCVGRPLAVFLDSLDRDDAAQVENVLDTLQTLLHECTGAVFVAADRRWLLTSAEETRQPYRKPLEIPGKPLGHQILARRFDLSLSIPVNWTPSAVSTPFTQADSPPVDPIDRVLDSSPRLRSRHRLAVEALGPICSRPELSPNQLSTWVLLALRWPLLAEFLVAHPSRISHFRYDQQPSEAPSGVGPLFIEPEIVALLRTSQQLVLDEAALRKLCAPFSATRQRVPVA